MSLWQKEVVSRQKGSQNYILGDPGNRLSFWSFRKTKKEIEPTPLNLSRQDVSLKLY